ncbi:hypothetical protein HDU85_003609 [Gaertneriomyces sp. JEL0708]|nr:hypothetical protein HDU85_003609 [Gaertneriomyces sp. JEL0708]
MSSHRKLSIQNLATSPMAVNFHTWRVNALTTNAFRQVTFLDRVRDHFLENNQRYAKKTEAILNDLRLSTPQLPSNKCLQGENKPFIGLITLLDDRSLEDADWLVVVKTYLDDDALFEEFKDVFAVRDDDGDANQTVRIPGSGEVGVVVAAASAPAAEDEDDPSQGLSRRSSRVVKFNAPETPGTAEEERHTYFPPTPAAALAEMNPLETATAPAEHDHGSPTMDTPTSPEVTLPGHYIAYDLHVAMMDRPEEMRDLVIRNEDYFSNVRNTLRQGQSWDEFEALLYTSREEMDDLTWMRSIEAILEPTLVAYFRELVGYDYYEEVNDNEDAESTDSDEASETFTDEWLDQAVRMREMDIMQRLESEYPQFFANIKHVLEPANPSSPLLSLHMNAGDVTEKGIDSEYEYFHKIFFAPVREVSNSDWKTVTADCLKKGLLDQFREIVTYELELDEPRQSAAKPASRAPVSDVTATEEEIPSDSNISVRLRSDPTQLANLESSHPLFFNLLQKHLAPQQYQRFLRALYAPRSTISDAKWVSLITRRFLDSSRRLRQMFREVVGATVVNTGEILSSDDEEYTGGFDVPLRGLPDGGQRMLRLEALHPSLFNNIKAKLGDQYGRFRALLHAPRSELPDDVWCDRIEESLNDAKLAASFAKVADIAQTPKPSKPVQASSSSSQGGGDMFLDLDFGSPANPGSPASPASPGDKPSGPTRADVYSLVCYSSLRRTLQDDKTFGRLLHAIIETHEGQKLASREPASAGSMTELTGLGVDQENVNVDLKSVLTEVIDQDWGMESDIGRRFAAWCDKEGSEFLEGNRLAREE